MEHSAGLLLLICLLVSGCAGKHFQPFSKADWVRQGVNAAAIVIDLGQTKDIKNHLYIEETNHLYGKDPADNMIEIVFPLIAVGNGLVAWYLDPEQRLAWWAFTTVPQVATIINNENIGLSPVY